ncbi:MAG: DoxX family protein [Nannocystaceae bacterium]|nr:DoxX family protein [Nannocystaceae bacterium]
MHPDATVDSRPRAPARSIHLAAWVAQALLAAAFLMAGFAKLTSPVEALAAQMPWVTGAMGRFVRLIGAVEIAGALGLLLPAATRIQPRLTVLAALGLAVVMVLAAITHASRGEWAGIVANVVLGGLAAFVLWARSSKAPIRPR